MSRPEPVFVDTGFWLALIDAGDRLHPRAVALAQSNWSEWLTTEAILVEVGNALSRARWRHLGSAFLADVVSDPRIEVVPVPTERFRAAIDLYRSRHDKEWGLTDCISFVVMEERGIRAALAADQHFVQAGYRALLLEEP